MAETGVCSLWMWNWAIANFYKPYSFLHISSNQKVYLTIHSFYRLILNNFCCYLEYFPPWPINSIYSIAWHTCNAYRLPLFIFALIEKWRKRRGGTLRMLELWVECISWIFFSLKIRQPYLHPHKLAPSFCHEFWSWHLLLHWLRNVLKAVWRFGIHLYLHLPPFRPFLTLSEYFCLYMHELLFLCGMKLMF